MDSIEEDTFPLLEFEFVDDVSNNLCNRTLDASMMILLLKTLLPLDRTIFNQSMSSVSLFFFSFFSR